MKKRILIFSIALAILVVGILIFQTSFSHKVVSFFASVLGIDSGEICTSSTIKGDASGDGQVTPADSQIVFDIYLQKRSTPTNISCIDMNNDNQITPKDASVITNIYLGKCAANGVTNASNVCDSTNCGSSLKCNGLTVGNECNAACQYVRCADTDNGKDYYVKGTVSGIDAGGNYSSTDSCVNENPNLSDDKRLIEYYCEGNRARSALYTCQYGCQDGVCKKDLIDCTPSTIKGDINNDGQVTPADSQIVFDIYLQKRLTPTNISCIDMNNDNQITPKDASVITNIYLGKCAANGVVDPQNFCDSINCGSSTLCHGLTAGNKCNAACQYMTCVDSDNGKDYYVKGTTSGVKDDGNFSITDWCDNDVRLVENFCNGNIFGNEYYICQHGCQDGACKGGICNTGINYELSSDHVSYDRNLRQETSYIIPGTSIKLGIKNLKTGITDFNSGYIFESDRSSVVKIMGNLAVDNVTRYDDYNMLVNVSIPELRNCKNIKQPIKTIIGDPFLKEDIGFIYPKSIIPKNVLNPNQDWATISVEQAMNKFQLPEIVELAYGLQTQLFGVKPIEGDAIILALMPPWCGGAGPIAGFGVGCLIAPNNEPHWGIIFHEIGHVFTGHFQLEWVDGIGGSYPTNNRIFMNFNGNYGLTFSEGTATLAAMYTEYYLVKNHSQYGLNQDVFNSLDAHFRSRQGYVNDLRNYERGGNDFTKIDANILDGIFFELANDSVLNPYGWDLYSKALKIYLNPPPSFITGPLTDIQSHTYFIAGLSAASGSDLRTKFRAWGFPIDDNYFDQILPILQGKIGANIIGKPITEKPAVTTLLKSESADEIYKIINDKKLWIPTAEVFNKAGYSWNSIQVVADSVLNAYPRLKLARAAGDPKVYYLTESGLKRWIPTEAIFNAYNNSWADVVEISNTEILAIADAFLIKLQDGVKVYKLENNQKRWIKTAEAFNRLGFDWNKICPVNQTEMDYYSEGSVIE